MIQHNKSLVIICYGKDNLGAFGIEFEIPDDQVLLSDFDVWHIVLCNGLVSESEEEDNQHDAYYAVKCRLH